MAVKKPLRKRRTRGRNFAGMINLTGMMTAIYRIAVEGWSKEDAIAEMTQGGFGFHEVWKNLVDYVRELDVERLKREAGIRSDAK